MVAEEEKGGRGTLFGNAPQCFWQTLAQQPVWHHQTQGQFHPAGHKTVDLLSSLAHHQATLGRYMSVYISHHLKLHLFSCYYIFYFIHLYISISIYKFHVQYSISLAVIIIFGFYSNYCMPSILFVLQLLLYFILFYVFHVQSVSLLEEPETEDNHRQRLLL